MADLSTAAAIHHAASGNVTIHDLLQFSSGSAVGTGAPAWPPMDSMNLSKDVLALLPVNVDLTPVTSGEGMIIVWRGESIFMPHRTPADIKAAQDVPLGHLIEPRADAARVRADHDPWTILIGMCAHLDCVPLGNEPSNPCGKWDGWFCACHGSHHDTVGRVRHGPAPANLALPPYAFEFDTKIKVG